MDRTEATAHPGGAASPGRSERQVGERLEEREHQIDEREREADEREREADEREEHLQERAARLRQHAVKLRARGMDIRGQAEQAVERAAAVLRASQDRMRRAEAALGREYARAARQQANVARSVWQGEQRPVPQQRDVTDRIARVSAMRKRTAAAAARLAETEQQAARILDELAARDPGNLQQKRLADEAREAARRARESERKYSSS